MRHDRRRSTRTRRALEQVACLDCGSAYTKPVRGGTTVRNPGCPECGYVGWRPLAVHLPVLARRPG